MLRTAEEILKDLIHPDGMIDSYADEVISKLNGARKEALQEAMKCINIYGQPINSLMEIQSLIDQLK